VNLPTGSLSHSLCHDLLDISAQILKAVVTDMFTEAAIPPEAILKAVSFANLSALMLPSDQHDLEYG